MEKIEEVKDERGKADGNFNVQNDAKFSLKSFFHTWTLDNFSKCLNFADASIYSPVFEFDNTNWRFLLHVISEDHQLKEIKIRPCKVNKDGITHYLRYNISICDADIGNPLTTKTSEARLENETFGHRLTFKFDGDEKEALKSVLENDKLIFHCEFLVLSAIPCDQESEKKVPAKNPAKKNVIRQWMRFTPKKTIPGRSKCFVNHVDCMKDDAEKFCLAILILVTMAVGVLMTVMALNNAAEKKNIDKQVNELIIDTTLKVYDIAEAFNFTEVKMKSLELLSSYHKLYDSSNVAPDKYFNAISSKLKQNISA